MRKFKSLISLSSFVLCLFFSSCSTHDENENNFSFKTFELEDSLGVTFDKEYNLGYNNLPELNKLIDSYISVLFNKEAQGDTYLVGFEIVISFEKTKTRPITNEKKNTERLNPTAPCPDGFEDRGVCYSEKCVRDAVQAYFAEHADDFSDGKQISFQLVDAGLGKRVCARTS